MGLMWDSRVGGMRGPGMEVGIGERSAEILLLKDLEEIWWGPSGEIRGREHGKEAGRNVVVVASL